jgi:hypothetical protein
VAYFHEWEDAGGARGGQFVYWDGKSHGHAADDASAGGAPSGAPGHVPPAPRSGSGVDGSKVIHAAVGYRMRDAPPAIEKSARNELVFRGDEPDAGSEDAWTIESNGAVVSRLRTDDLRFSVVYRARCFASEEERAEYARQQLPANRAAHALTLDQVLTPLKAELVRRGRYTAAALESMPRLSLALALMDEFISYPGPQHGWVPVNFCAAGAAVPALAPLLAWVCP